MAQASLAWLLSKDVVSAPIIGTTSLQNLEQLIGTVDFSCMIIYLTVIVAAVHIKLTDEEIKSLEEPYKAQGILGH
jgi:aryl-alcohol dehydrogenase-like predicted oxidoreductase